MVVFDLAGAQENATCLSCFPGSYVIYEGLFKSTFVVEEGKERGETTPTSLVYVGIKQP